MIDTVVQGSALLADQMERHGDANPHGVLSDAIIPAVPGEFYSYSAQFTDKQPLYVLMKCKANKSREIDAAEELGQEANLLFRINDANGAQVYAVRDACTSGLLGDSVDIELFGHTWIAPVEMTAGDFHRLRFQQNVHSLVEICRTACSSRNTSATLSSGSIVAMETDQGKYGIFRVRKLTQVSIEIDACHILL